ncbi:MAG TPA: guanylate kinase [Thermoanaerobaculia bacterium]|jgi:guanylate kinase|nr:guanylate kinase [Thermoanaerobaculia bacterium]
MQPGELFILSAPSGAGKTTLIQSLLAGGFAEHHGGLAFSVSHTTRKPRQGEADGRDYHFVDHATFLGMIEADAFLEWAKVHDNYYGTSRQEVFPRLEEGIDVLLDIDVQGAEQVVARCPEAHSIFVLPPSYEDLERRLRRRALDDDGAIARRLGVSIGETRRYDQYHYVIINDDARHASEALAAIIIEKRHRRVRMQPRIQEILRDFQDRGATPPT